MEELDQLQAARPEGGPSGPVSAADDGQPIIVTADPRPVTVDVDGRQVVVYVEHPGNPARHHHPGDLGMLRGPAGDVSVSCACGLAVLVDAATGPVVMAEHRAEVERAHADDELRRLDRQLEAIKARPDQLEDELRAASEAKTRRLEAERVRQINEVRAQAIHALGLDQNGDQP
jgi:hypothetical protein